MNRVPATARAAGHPVRSPACRLPAWACLVALAGPLVAAPAISLTTVPSIGSTANLTGAVGGVDPSAHRVAVFIFVEGWWTKPTYLAPLTTIRPDGTWTCDITTGGADPYATMVAAYLVAQSYSPPLLGGAAVLPPALEENALASVIAERPSPAAFHWCGYDWDVKNSGSFVFGPGPNLFSDNPANVWVDPAGKLHLRITHRDGQWQCAEVVSRRSFGYGIYRFFVDSAVDALDPNVTLGLFTYDHDPTETGGHRELDVEFARWGNPGDPTNAQFVVQPFGIPGNLTRWTLPAGTAPATHSFEWSPGGVAFTSHAGSYVPPPGVPELTNWTWTGAALPVPGAERVRMNLWLFNGNPPGDGREVEVVIGRFAFIPLQPAAPQVLSATRTAGGNLHLALRGEPQLWYQLESSPDLLNWTPQPPFIAPEPEFTLDPPAAGPSRFYRVAVVPGQ